jgi:hypothetical protein
MKMNLLSIILSLVILPAAVAPVSASAKEHKSNTATKQISSSPRRNYCLKLLGLIAWDPPANSAFREDVVSVTILRDGSIVNVEIKERSARSDQTLQSSAKDFDRSVVAALKRVNKKAPLPRSVSSPLKTSFCFSVDVNRTYGLVPLVGLEDNRTD